MSWSGWVVLLLVALIGAVVFLVRRLRDVQAERDATARQVAYYTERFRGVVDAEAERQRVLVALDGERRHAVAALERAHAEARATIARTQEAEAQARGRMQQERAAVDAQLAWHQHRLLELRTELSSLDEEANFQSFGFYKPRYDFSTSAAYQAQLERVRQQQKQRLKNRTAATSRVTWLVNGSTAEGQKQTQQMLKLMLRAFNGECDAAIARVKYNNVQVMEARIRKAAEVINGLSEVQECEITEGYLALKLEELALAHEVQEKIEQEREVQRRLREQMREEEAAQRELDRAQAEAEREERRYADALRKAQEDVEGAAGKKQEKLLGEIEELQRRLAEAQANKQRAVSRAQLTRSGHVYVISNVGSFGEHVYKIGMTRRLDPMDRVKELGDASVPFQFDVHAVIYAEDAPGLETALHRAFHHRRVNRVNEKKEFFRVPLEEIVTAVNQTRGAEVEFVQFAEAVEYRKTLAMGEAREEPRVREAVVAA
ncbi:uncharacterized protein CMC5_051540 [Chondromyces crocatus]|uniref:Bacteriophage T5 Orf172 DNA-binding domain-containing protein n=2 Tax=Chondromyces crocatus TaxID=52 RepID=A0A0K1EJY2_CHOCO|nr:uncharacterized protein CMC5_051540 [Chondromyces crocatus]